MKPYRAAATILTIAVLPAFCRTSLAAGPEFGRAEFFINGQPAPPASLSMCGLSAIAGRPGPQLLLTERPPRVTVNLLGREEAAVAVAVRDAPADFKATVEANVVEGGKAGLTLALAGKTTSTVVEPGKATRLELSGDLRSAKVYVTVRGSRSDANKSLAALQHARGHIQGLIGSRMKLRHTPLLRFIEDKELGEALRVDRLIDKVMREDAESEQQGGPLENGPTEA